MNEDPVLPLFEEGPPAPRHSQARGGTLQGACGTRDGATP
jgi:hypothetical protein